MSSVGLLYVGAVLFINGLMLIGVVPGKSAAVINYFVGAMQVIFPTLIILGSNGDLPTIFGAAGLYLFGFTYLYVALNQTFNLAGDGLGWFSLFVTICALVIGYIQIARLNDPVFAVIWWSWAVLWFMFFLLLGAHMDSIGVATGWFTIFVSFYTGTFPALLLLTGDFESTGMWGIILAIIAAVCLIVSFVLRNVPHRRDAGVDAEAGAPLAAPQQ